MSPYGTNPLDWELLSFKKPSLFFISLLTKHESMKVNLSQKAMKLAPNDNCMSIFVSFTSYIYIHIYTIFKVLNKFENFFFCYKCTSFVPSNDGDDHMNMAHISETTLDTAKKFHICSSPLGNVYEVSWKSDHFLNFRHKWVKFKWCIILLNNQWRLKSHHGQRRIPLFCSQTSQKISLICPAVTNYVPVFT